MENFNYHRPSDIASAATILTKNPEAKLLSGGMTLIPTMKQGLAAPSDIVDLAGLKNSGVSLSGSTVSIKAGTVHYDVASNADIRKAIPALAKLAGGIGDPHVRNRGTIGGSISNNDPAADYPSAILGLGATVVTSKRKVSGDQFFTGMFQTAISADEIVTAVEFPVPKRAAYAKFPNPASRYAMVGVFVSQGADGKVRVAVTGAGSCVFRVPAMEAALEKDFSESAIAGIQVPADKLNEDMHGSAAYRAHLVTVMAQRAVAAAK